MGKYSDFPFQTPWVRPTSAIYTPKWDDEHPCHFYMGVPPSRNKIDICLKWTLVLVPKMSILEEGDGTLMDTIEMTSKFSKLKWNFTAKVTLHILCA